MKHTKFTFFALSLVAVLLAGPLTGIAQPTLREIRASPPDKYADCLQCHDYEDNHHPVNIKPAGEMTFPLRDGKMTCITCHHGDHISGDRFYLRGGPYSHSRDICGKCHLSDGYAGVNPHVMLDENGAVRKIIGGLPVCIICHVNTPDPKTDRTEDVQFRADVGFLCWRCHQPMANNRFLHEHFRMRPSYEMRQDIKKNEEAMNVLIPLVPRDRVTCSTCHNPHQEGVILREAAAKGADTPAKLRIPSPRLCVVCHAIKL